jgi:hypothetical protein
MEDILIYDCHRGKAIKVFSIKVIDKKFVSKFTKSDDFYGFSLLFKNKYISDIQYDGSLVRRDF